MPVRHQHLFAIIWCWLACAWLSAQTPAPATATVEGIVVAADTGQPLRRAQVRLVGTASSMASTVTDANGRFVFADVRAGDYTVAASKPSYLDMVVGSRRFGLTSPGTPFRVTAGQKIENIQLRLPRTSVISGTVTDEFGDPAFNTAVRVMRYVYGYGERYASSFGQQDFTDDKGTYRIAGLVPGEYVVSAVPRDVVSQLSAQREMVRDRLAAMTASAKASVGSAAGLPPEAVLLSQPIDPKGYVPVHYPGSVIASDASAVRVGLSEEVHGIDIRLQVVHTATVTGTVSWSEGVVPAGARVQLLDPAMPMPTLGSWWTGLRAGGKFVFHGVAPGSYVVRVSTSAAGADLFAEAPIHVDPSHTNDIEVRLQRGMTLAGAVSIEGTPIVLSRLRVMLRPVPTIAGPELAVERATLDPATGRFVFRGLVPARYRFQFEGLPAGWQLASAVFGGRDLADYLVDVEPGRNVAGGVLRFTSRSGEIAGVVTNAAGQPILNAVVLVFPEDRRLWLPQSRRIHVAPIGSDGRYAVKGLPPGDYRVIVADPEPQQQFDVEYLGQLFTLARLVAVAEGDRKTQDLTVK
jgi:hypothetical protein